MTNNLTAEQIEQLATAIAAGNKIEAIKLYRSFSGSDLKDSKDFIEKLTAELRAQDPVRFPQPTRKGCLVLILALLPIGLLAALFGER